MKKQIQVVAVTLSTDGQTDNSKSLSALNKLLKDGWTITSKTVIVNPESKFNSIVLFELEKSES
jgi:hypothetical protein